MKNNMAEFRVGDNPYGNPLTDHVVYCMKTYLLLHNPESKSPRTHLCYPNEYRSSPPQSIKQITPHALMLSPWKPIFSSTIHKANHPARTYVIPIKTDLLLHNPCSKLPRTHLCYPNENRSSPPQSIKQITAHALMLSPLKPIFSSTIHQANHPTRTHVIPMKTDLLLRNPERKLPRPGIDCGNIRGNCSL